MSPGKGVDGTTVHKYQEPLLKAVEWYRGKIKCGKLESAAAHPEYERLTELRLAVQNCVNILDKPFELLFRIVLERRDYLLKESKDEIAKLNEFIDEMVH